MPHLGLALTLAVDPPLTMREIAVAERAVTERMSGVDAMVSGGSGDAEGLVSWVIGTTTDLRPAAVISLLDQALLDETAPGGTLAGRMVTVEAVEAAPPQRPSDAWPVCDRPRSSTPTPSAPSSALPTARSAAPASTNCATTPTARPISAGVWLRATAEHYAETRNRRAGRPTAPRRPADRTYCAECRHDAATHGIDTNHTFDGTPDDGAPCRSVVIEDGTVRNQPCDCAGYRPSPAA